MILIRESKDRGHANRGWLDTYHTFSFADYYDPAWMGFGSLRVINEDRIAGGAGFDMHPHREMEILTWVLSGALAHGDSLGHRAVLRPGELQRISAGTGIEHSEHNLSPSEPVHLLQIWIQPGRKGVQPAYDQRSFHQAVAQGGPVLLATGRSGPTTEALEIQQDADVWVVGLAPDEAFVHRLEPGRQAWIQVTKGSVKVKGRALQPGDAMGLTQEAAAELRAMDNTQVLLFDLA